MREQQRWTNESQSLYAVGQSGNSTVSWRHNGYRGEFAPVQPSILSGFKPGKTRFGNRISVFCVHRAQRESGVLPWKCSKCSLKAVKRRKIVFFIFIIFASVKKRPFWRTWDIYSASSFPLFCFFDCCRNYLLHIYAVCMRAACTLLKKKNQIAAAGSFTAHLPGQHQALHNGRGKKGSWLL